MDQYRFPFEKPNTPLNRLMDKFHGPIRHELGTTEVDCWRKGSRAAFERLGMEVRILDQVEQGTLWHLSAAPAPQGTWYGEVLLRRPKDPPAVTVYADSLTARLPTQFLFELAGQAGMDHLFGHLAAHAQGEDWGEEAACRLQYQAALARKTLAGTVTALSVMLVQNAHKQIPFSNYR